MKLTTIDPYLYCQPYRSLLKSFIQVHLFSYLKDFGVIHQTQSGFRRRHSTEVALTVITEKWPKALNEGKHICTIMVDFWKSFDLVDHNLHLKKLKYYKCSHHFIKLIKSYTCTCDRSQVVKVRCS